MQDRGRARGDEQLDRLLLGASRVDREDLLSNFGERQDPLEDVALASRRVVPLLRVVEPDLSDVVGPPEQAAEESQLVGDVAWRDERVKAERDADAFAPAQVRLQHLEPRRQLGDGDGDYAGAFGGAEYRRRVVEAVDVAVAVDEQTQTRSPPAASASSRSCPAPVVIHDDNSSLSRR